MSGRARSRPADGLTVDQSIVGSAGVPELADLPDTLAGFAQAIIRLRDRDAPNVLLAYHVSSWGTGTDLCVNNAWDIAGSRRA
jgi:hypothetical protein